MVPTASDEEIGRIAQRWLERREAEERTKDEEARRVAMARARRADFMRDVIERPLGEVVDRLSKKGLTGKVESQGDRVTTATVEEKSFSVVVAFDDGAPISIRFDRSESANGPVSSDIRKDPREKVAEMVEREFVDFLKHVLR